ncbi:MAG: hypothetical protein JXR43_04685 [Burkholderiaceae bacterium]|nr:hypothetical protein [Burkholderiaceae bacterium]
MRRHLCPLLLASIAALCVVAQSAAQAQSAPVWRCGTTYSHQPCAQGQPLALQDARTPEQQGQARTQAEQTRAFADALHRENAAREAQQRKEEMARQKSFLKEQAALQRAQRKAQASRDKAARQMQNRHRPAQTRRVVKPPSAQPGATAPAAISR